MQGKEIAIAVVERDGQFLIGRRPPDVPLAGLWEFPGGKMLPHESPEVAAVRECLEETDLVVLPMFRYPGHTHTYSHGTVHLHFIACQPAGGVTTVRPPFRWIARAELSQFEFPAGNQELLRLLAAS